MTRIVSSRLVAPGFRAGRGSGPSRSSSDAPTTDEFKAFYPTSVIGDRLDILFFWVARMVMMAPQLTHVTVPGCLFACHGPGRGREKNTPSLGNVIDP